MKLRVLSALLLSSTVIALFGCIAGLTYTRGVTPFIFLDGSVVVVAGASGSPITPELAGPTITEIVGYPLNATGSPTPSITVAPPANTDFYGAATDAAGNVYTLSRATCPCNTVPPVLVQVYDPNSSTPTTPVRTITTNPANAINGPVNAFAVDPSGNVYVAFGDTAGTLVKYGPNAADVGSTPATPALTITGITNSELMTTDSSGNLYDVQDGPNTSYYYNVINVYHAGFTTSTPARTINPTTILGTNDTYFDGITVDGSGNIYTTMFTDPNDTPEIAVFSTTANVTPSRTITGSATTLTYAATGIAVDGSGNIYVRDGVITTVAVGSPPGAKGIQPRAGRRAPAIVDTFSASASGNVAPVNTFTAAVEEDGSGLAIH